MLSRHCQRALTAFALAAILEVFACPTAFAGPPTDRLREFFAKVNGALVDPTTEDRPLERVARVRRLVADIGDADGAAAAALGPEWETRTPAERDEFITLFADVLERGYVARFAGAARAAGGLTMTYGDEVVAGSEATVSAAVRSRGGHDLRVEYRMILRGGRWRVRDIVLDGVSTVENYRAQFRRLLQQGSYVTLVGQMREKLTAESLMFARSESRPVAAAPPPETRVIAAAPAAEVPAPVALPTPAVVERPQPAPAPAAVPPLRVARSTPPALAAVVKAAVAVPSPAPPSSAPVPPAPVVAGPVPGTEPSGVETALGALLLGLLGVGGASLLRRRPTSKRSRALLS